MTDPYYRMFPREWDDGTLGLSLEEEGALLRIVNATNSRGRPLEDDEATDREMAHRCRVSLRKWRTLKAALEKAGKITIKDGLILQARALTEVEHRREQARIAAEAGAKGGRKRAENAAKTDRKSAENQLKTPRKPSEIEDGTPENNDLDQANHKPLASNEANTRAREDDPPGDKPPVEDPWKFFDRFWRAYPPDGKVSASEERARFAFGPTAVKLGAERVARAAENYAKAVQAANTKPVGIFRFLTVSEGLIERYADERGGAGRSDASWRIVVRLYRDTGKWSVSESPPPGAVGCRVPAHILEEFGYGERKADLKVVGGAA